MQKTVGGIPRGVGAPPPPGMDPRRGHGKLMCIKVRMLDDSVAVFHLGHKAYGQALFDEVCRHLNLLECDYFGLEFIDGYGNRCWLEKDKSILRQITTAQSDARFYFICKFYTPNPTELEEEYTRYLLGLQIRRDLAHGELLCNENTAALLVSFIVQAECGDFSADDYPDHTYLSVTNFVPNQTVAFQQKVMENHKKLVGMGPGEADLALLETARRCDFYGIKLHAAKDIEGTDVALSVAHMGIKVFHQLNCISTFSWAKIRKLSFKRKRLMIKLHPESYQYYKETIEFNFENRDECKNFWKKCVEHHAFFRCLDAPSFEYGTAGGATLGSVTSSGVSTIAAIAAGAAPAKKDTRRLFSQGSSFRYQGRTQKQLIDFVREHRKRREPFQRPLRSTRAGADPYGVIRGDIAPRKIQFNVLDPMLVSTVSAGGGFTVPPSNTTVDACATLPAVTKAATGMTRCCALQTPHYHQPQQVYNSGGGNISGELSQQYPDVYYPLGAKSQEQTQQQVLYQQQQQQRLQQQYYHYHHYGNPQQKQPQQSQIYSSHGDRSYNYYHQPCGMQLQEQQQQKYNQQQEQQKYQQQRKQQQYASAEMASTRNTNAMRPKSVYAARHSDYDVNATAVAAMKNHHSSSDVASISASSNMTPSARPLQARAPFRREDSVPPAVPEGDEEAAHDNSSPGPAQSTQASGDQMSTSLPNVLAEDLKVLCQEYRQERNGPVTAGLDGGGFFTNPPPKSMSGESFLDDLRGGHVRHHHHLHYHSGGSRQQRDVVTDFIYDNMSEGSYRLGRTDGGGGNSSSTSDVGVDALSARALSTTFTTKRVGNVIVKRVIDSSNPTKQNNSKQPRDVDEDESSYAESCCKMSSVSAPTTSRYHVEHRPIRQRVPLPSTLTDVLADTYSYYHRPSPPVDVTKLPPGDAIVNNDIYLKNYVIEQEQANRGDMMTARGILKNSATIKPTLAAMLTTATPSVESQPPRPILIDDQPESGSPTNDFSDTHKTADILTRNRPIIVTPISIRNPNGPATSGGSASSSTFSTPQPMVKNFDVIPQEHKIPIATSDHTMQHATAPSSSTTNGKPIVQGAKFTRISTLADGSKLNDASEISRRQSEVVKGIPGRVISKQNMVITPSGILPKEEITRNQGSEKPKVPPKPKEIKNVGTVQTTSSDRVNDVTCLPSAGETQSQNTENKLLEPLNTILAESSDNNNNNQHANKSKEIKVKAQPQEQKVYEQIRVSVQSEDEPDVRRLQTFGSGAQIPYTLTMRNVETPKSAKVGDAFPLLTKVRRQKTLDLIERKQLPSQNSFSSQDHSISPTSADSGNVVEYIMRRRSISSERCSPSDSGKESQRPTRRERRRQTQPVSLLETAVKRQADNLPSSSKAPVLTENNKRGDRIAPKASPDEDLPEPPPASLLSGDGDANIINAVVEDEAQKLARKIVSGILETDF